MSEVELGERLVEILGRHGVLPVDRIADFAVDDLVPSAVVAPESSEQVQQVLRFADELDLAVVPWGGGTAMHVGNIPRRYDIALLLTRLDQILEHEPADLTVSVQAGIRLTDLQRHLARFHQFLPLDPPFADQATIGGILATAASGPLRYAYGAPRDLMIGLTVVQADGTLTRAGGRVVKNVAGYDIGKLHIGALGTLGVITEARFKIMPLPAVDRTVLLTAVTIEEATNLVFALDRANLGLKALVLLNREAARVLDADLPAIAVRIGGETGAVEAITAHVHRLAQEAGAAWRDVEAGETVWEKVRRVGTGGGEREVLRGLPLLTARASLLPTQVAPFLQALEQLAPSMAPVVSAIIPLGSITSTWHLNEPETASGLANDLYQLSRRFGAQLWLEAAPRDIKEQVDVWGLLPESFPLMQQLKAQLDPKRCLNPGRYVGRL